jgi:hypothetical protein
MDEESLCISGRDRHERDGPAEKRGTIVQRARPTIPIPDALTRIIRARIEGADAAAFTEMIKIRFVAPGRKTERWPAMSVISRIYARDHYQCRYCGERLILTAGRARW